MNRTMYSEPLANFNPFLTIECSRANNRDLRCPTDRATVLRCPTDRATVGHVLRRWCQYKTIPYSGYENVSTHRSCRQLQRGRLFEFHNQNELYNDC